MLYLAVYPRTDFMHWVTAAPMSLVLLTVLLSRLAEPVFKALSVGRLELLLA